MNIQTPESRLRFREAVGLEIERLINLLDVMEGDPDLEPYLAGEGWAGQMGGSLDDREGDLDEDEGDGSADDEPSLGSPELRDRTSQVRWAQGGADDREDDDEREEENEHGGDILDEPHDQTDEGNDEPTLGWSNPMRTQRDEMPAGWACIDTDGAIARSDFRGEGHVAAARELRERGLATVWTSSSWQNAHAPALPDPGSLFLRISRQ
jgi:hypothetical protein